MSGLVDKWAGKLYGTNTGNLFIELNQKGSDVSGVIRFLDDVRGLAIYNFTGKFKDRLILDCIPDKSNQDQELGNIVAEAVLTPEGNLRGTWHSSIGTAGTFDAFPHYINWDQASKEAVKIQEQIYNKNISIGSIRLFSEDIKRLIDFVGHDFKQASAIITYNQRGNQVTKYAKDFLRDIDELGEIKYLKIFIQEPEAHGINRVVVVEFVERGISEVRVSGINEAWVVGKAESVFQAIRPKQNTLVTTYKKYGLNLNTIIFFAMLIAIPEIIGWKNRSLFVVIVFTLLNILIWIHSKFIPNTIIYLTGKKPSILSRIWPTILSWIVMASSAIFAAWIFYLLTKSKGN
jgi:hypothetical protein